MAQGHRPSRSAQRQARAPHPLRLHDGSAGRTASRARSLGQSVGGYAVGMESTVNAEGHRHVGAAGRRRRLPDALHAVRQGSGDAAKIGLYFYKDDEKPDLMMRETRARRPVDRDAAARTARTRRSPTSSSRRMRCSTRRCRTRTIAARYSKLEIRYPDGKQETILNVPLYDFNWQRYVRVRRADQDPGRLEGDRHLRLRQLEAEPGQPGSDQGDRLGRPVVRGDVLHSLRFRWADETAAKQTDYDSCSAARTDGHDGRQHRRQAAGGPNCAATWRPLRTSCRWRMRTRMAAWTTPNSRRRWRRSRK